MELRLLPCHPHISMCRALAAECTGRVAPGIVQTERPPLLDQHSTARTALSIAQVGWEMDKAAGKFAVFFFKSARSRFHNFSS
jgi:hypothetical protein